MVVLDLLAGIILITGTLLALVGTIGLVRLPEFFARSHAAGLISGIGMGGVVLGLILLAGWSLLALKLFLVFLFAQFTSPIISHTLVRMAHKGGQPMPVGNASKEDSDP